MNKNAFAKILFAAVAIVSALVGLNGRAAAQLHPPAQCCSPSQMPIVTSANGWTVKAPTCCGGYTAVMPVQEVAPLYAGWHPAIGQSHWIANDSTAGMYNEPIGDYTYTYRFCLCTLPSGLQGSTGAMFISILSDNSFTAYLNASGAFVQGGPTSFSAPTTGTAPGNAFVSGWNTLRIIVHNDRAWTGLDVSGWVAGYFGTCSHPAPINNPTSTQRRRGTPPPQH